MKKRLFIGLAVRAPTGMTALPKVHEAARKMADFADASPDYDDAILLTDEHDDLSADVIEAALPQSLLLDRPRIHVYFCGHGAIMDGAEIWYLTDGQGSWRERVDVMAFREVLASYGPEQLCIFSDACQIPTHHSTKASAILDEYQGAAGRPEIDVFRATIEGEPAFASKTDGPLFTKAVTEALTAQPAASAFDDLLQKAYGRDVVTNNSLAIYLRNNLPDYAALFGKNQHPELSPALVYHDNDYVKMPQLTSGGSGNYANNANGTNPFPPHPGACAAGATPYGSARLSSLPTATMRSATAINNALTESDSETREPFWYAGVETADVMEAQSRLFVSVNGQRPIESLNIDLHPFGFSNTRRPAGIYNGFAYFDRSDGLNGDGSLRSALLRVDDTFVPLSLGLSWNLSLLVGLYLTDEPERSGAYALGWHEVGMGSPPRPRLSPMRILKGLLNGKLGADAIAQIAAEMRFAKHYDPLFGIVAAYLYDRAGDIDAIRRMCYFYPAHGQAIPFDIAMLARLPLQIVPGEGFFTDVPAVWEDIRAKEADLPEFVWQHTQDIGMAPVSGLVPTLRLGWSRMAYTAERGSTLREIAELRDMLSMTSIASVAGYDKGRALRDRLEKLFRTGT
jgi:hypothetical protein